MGAGQAIVYGLTSAGPAVEGIAQVAALHGSCGMARDGLKMDAI